MAGEARVINLLPDDKQKLLRVQRVNALVTAASLVVLVVCIAVIIIFAGIIGGEQFNLGQLHKQIDNRNAEIKEIDTLSDGSSVEKQSRTIQAQLALLHQAYEIKDKQLFAKSVQRIAQILPPAVNFSSASIDSTGAVTVSGSAKTYNDVSRFAQALKDDGRKINLPTSGTGTNYFTNVKIANASATGTGSTVQYSINYTLGSGVTGVK